FILVGAVAALLLAAVLAAGVLALVTALAALAAATAVAGAGAGGITLAPGHRAALLAGLVARCAGTHHRGLPAGRITDHHGAVVINDVAFLVDLADVTHRVTAAHARAIAVDKLVVDRVII